MLTEKLWSLLNKVLNQYQTLGLEKMASSVIDVLRSRDVGNSVLYTNGRNNVLQAIGKARADLDPTLDRADIISFFEKSNYDIVLPRDVLRRLESMLPLNMTIAATSTEAQIVSGSLSRTVNDFRSTCNLLASLQVSDDTTKTDEDRISFAIRIAETSVDAKFSNLAEITEEISELIKITSSYFLQSEEVAVLSHVSMTDLLYYFELTKEYAPVFIEIWRVALDTAKLFLSQRAFLKQARDNGMKEEILGSIKETATATTEAHMAKALQAIGVGMVAEGLSGDVKIRVSRSVEKISGRIIEGAALTIESEMALAVDLVAGAENEHVKQKAGELQRLIAEIQGLQTQLALTTGSAENMLRIQQQ